MTVQSTVATVRFTVKFHRDGDRRLSGRADRLEAFDFGNLSDMLLDKSLPVCLYCSAH